MEVQQSRHVVVAPAHPSSDAFVKLTSRDDVLKAVQESGFNLEHASAAPASSSKCGG